MFPTYVALEHDDHLAGAVWGALLSLPGVIAVVSDTIRSEPVAHGIQDLPAWLLLIDCMNCRNPRQKIRIAM
jgi:hypothetical protein